MYYIYHIPGKKIGVTCNLNSRVTLMQGYEPGEYEVLDSSNDIDYISKQEIILQKQYGYRVDNKLYKNLFKRNEMKINVTEQTTTFPCPVNKLKGQLMDNLGMQWHTDHGQFEINATTIPWIMNHAKTSMYDDNRCYVYNKAFAKMWGVFDTNECCTEESCCEDQCCETGECCKYETELCCEVDDCCKDNTVFNRIRQWADERGLYEKGDAKTQYLKLMEEAGELGRALLKDDIEEQIDAIGDMVVVLTNLAELIDVPIEECIESAYEVISQRTGKMVNGTFVKDN
jgi:NTP pyrophosphatase (non-canonical NTP hydrolase)